MRQGSSLPRGSGGAAGPKAAKSRSISRDFAPFAGGGSAIASRSPGPPPKFVRSPRAGPLPPPARSSPDPGAAQSPPARPARQAAAPPGRTRPTPRAAHAVPSTASRPRQQYARGRQHPAARLEHVQLVPVSLLRRAVLLFRAHGQISFLQEAIERADRWRQRRHEFSVETRKTGESGKSNLCFPNSSARPGGSNRLSALPTGHCPVLSGRGLGR